MSQHTFVSQRNDVLEKDIRNLQLNFNEILTSGQHYSTQDITNNIKLITNALDNIKLDHEFQRGSKNWAKQFDANEMKMNELNVKQVIAQGHDLSHDLQTCLHATSIQNKEENQMRELHSWACDALTDYLQVLQPFASSSYGRLDNIAHHLGVTDRYMGYRHNLTRGSGQPLNVHTIWADRKLPRAVTAVQQQSTPDWKNWVHAYRHYGPSATTAGSASSTRQFSTNNPNLLGYLRRAQTADMKRPSTTPNFASRPTVYESYQDGEVRKAGINLTFPGKTEFMDRYKKPEPLSCSPFTINPQPDFTLPGRPLVRVIPDTFNTEYTRSYVFPDSSKLERFPWLRS
ncbi:unnamed protein product [Adineta ricciae]|uniref:Uncharacterized protein n=1 Tax=Adineta ricciae TaxID=249248 RepID=A0A813Y8W7_ADIRI|nr:unnamed protein product [Adineta ricciae]CAF1143184.1 unnamed protein product [Adineta ricciae]